MYGEITYFEDISEQSSEDEPVKQPVQKRKKPNRTWHERE